MIALLTGPPGVGKTTIAATLVKRHPLHIETVSFGRLIYEAVRGRLGTNLSYTEFREAAAKLVVHDDITAATASVAGRRSSLAQKWLIVDSHAVAQTRYGWQAHPDTPDTLKLFSYDTIIHLHAPPEVILRRIKLDAAGRHTTTIRGIEISADIQMSISAYYAGIVGCPLEVVDASNEEHNVIRALEGALGLAPGPA